MKRPLRLRMTERLGRDGDEMGERTQQGPSHGMRD